MQDRAAPWVHAISVAVVAAATYWTEAAVPRISKAALLMAVVVGTARGVGWWLGRPKRDREREHQSYNRTGLIKVRQRAVNRAVHDVINALAVLKAEVDLAVAETFPEEKEG